MATPTEIGQPIPACPEDALLTWRSDALICGPSVDDAPVTIQTEDCDFLLGAGSYDAGTWTEYLCAAPLEQQLLPNTSITPPIEAGPLAWAGAIIIVIACVIMQARPTRPRR